MNKQKPSFDYVFSTYRQRVFELVFRFFHNQTNAEDITQEVFLRAHGAYEKFRSESEIYSWLYRIAVNLCNEKIRKKMQVKKHAGEISSLDQEFRDKDGAEKTIDVQDKSALSPLEELEKNEIREIVQEAIESMPEKYKQVVMLIEIGGMSYEETIQITGLSSSAVGVRLLRAREILKGKLKKYL